MKQSRYEPRCHAFQPRQLVRVIDMTHRLHGAVGVVLSHGSPPPGTIAIRVKRELATGTQFLPLESVAPLTDPAEVDWPLSEIP